MFISRARLVGLLVLVSLPFPLAAILPPDGWSAPAPAPRTTRTYRFEARITDNSGVTPLRVGDLIRGRFTYDLKARKIRPEDDRKDLRALPFGHYVSAQNAIEFKVGDLRFTGAGEVLVTVSAFGHAEHFGVVAMDLKLPKGWEIDHKQGSQTYGFCLQNAPTKKVLAGPGIPDRVALADFVNTKEVRLDFFHGVRFPGGQVTDRAIVYGAVERLEEIRR
jgi:hypothetical protein